MNTHIQREDEFVAINIFKECLFLQGSIQEFHSNLSNLLLTLFTAKEVKEKKCVNIVENILGFAISDLLKKKYMDKNTKEVERELMGKFFILFNQKNEYTEMENFLIETGNYLMNEDCEKYKILIEFCNTSKTKH